MHWIDLALRDDETGVAEAIYSLDERGRNETLSGLGAFLGMTEVEIQRAAIRLLVERARPLTLPARVWARPLTASDDPSTAISAYFSRRGIPESRDRLRRANKLYRQFAEERERLSVTLEALNRCSFRCSHCGLAFCNEDLARLGVESPFGSRLTIKADNLKRHWSISDMREPTTDHHWPVSLYGDNGFHNQRVLCKGCNAGKENCLAIEQQKSWIGLPSREQMLRSTPLPFELFYTQIRRAPVCAITGKDAKTAELTVRVLDAEAPLVLDNLETIESPGV